MNPLGAWVYVANFGSNTISVYQILGNGSLTPLAPMSTFAAGPNPVSLVVDPTGLFLYVANNIGSVSTYNIHTGTGGGLSLANTVAAGTEPSSVAVDPTGRFLYVTNETSGTVSGYTIDCVSRALTSITGSPFPTGGDPTSITVERSGQYAYVTNIRPSKVVAFKIDPISGALSQLNSTSLRALEPRSVTTTGITQ